MQILKTLKRYKNVIRHAVVLPVIALLYTPLLEAQNFNQILGRPTDKSITISLQIQANVDAYWEYGTLPGTYTQTTSTYQLVKNIPKHIEVAGLTPNTMYYYRLRYRLQGSLEAFNTDFEHSFHTARAAGSSFTFTIESDEHLYDKKGVKNLYKICLANQAADKPDFMFTLGDVFGDDHHPYAMDQAQLDSLHSNYRPLWGNICHSVPLFICLGNHEGEFNYYLNQKPPDNLGVYATLARKKYFSNPYPNEFYSGNPDVEGYGMGQPENYYSFTWGDALFVVLDAYRYQCDTSAKPKNWDWSLGQAQYNWLKTTLESSNAKYKFVMAHHVSGQGRGGAIMAHLFEWGGHDQNGNYLFASKRPGWAKPIHQLFVDNGVNIFFQGHDHLFAHEIVDEVVYQEIPMPSDSTYQIGMLANADAYISDVSEGSGHLRIQVSPECARVDFVRAYLPADTLTGGHHNREVAFSYEVGNCYTTGIAETIVNSGINVYPNPATNAIYIDAPAEVDFTFNLMNMLGQHILQTKSRRIDISDIPEGLYFLKVSSGLGFCNRKIVVHH